MLNPFDLIEIVKQFIPPWLPLSYETVCRANRTKRSRSESVTPYLSHTAYLAARTVPSHKLSNEIRDFLRSLEDIS
jgi:hypothetical protein